MGEIKNEMTDLEFVEEVRKHDIGDAYAFIHELLERLERAAKKESTGICN